MWKNFFEISKKGAIRNAAIKWKSESCSCRVSSWHVVIKKFTFQWVGRGLKGGAAINCPTFWIYLFEREDLGRIEVDSSGKLVGKEKKFSKGMGRRIVTGMRSSLVHILSAYPGCWLGRKEWLPNDGENAQRNGPQVSKGPTSF